MYQSRPIPLTFQKENDQNNGNLIYVVLGTSYYFSLFELDLKKDNSECPVSLDPILKIDYGDRLTGPGVFVFESKVYVFGGNPIPRYSSAPPSFEEMAQFMLTSVPSRETTIYDILTGSSCKAPPMTSGKSFPFTAIVNDKICVFSKDLKSAPNFELFDPKEISWSSLPELPSTEVKVKAFYVRDTCLYVSTTKTVYCIDVAPKNSGEKLDSWKKPDIVPFPFEGKGYCVKDTYITPYLGFSLKDPFPVHFFPPLENSPLVQFGGGGLMVALAGEDDRLPKFAIIRAGFKNYDDDYGVTRCPNLTVDVIKVVQQIPSRCGTFNDLLIIPQKTLAYSIQYEYDCMFLYDGFSQ